jgi:subtilase family serine protease
MKIIKVGFAIAVVGMVWLTSAQARAGQMLSGEVPPAIARLHLQPIGLLDATNRLQLAIGLPLRNHAALDRLLSEVYDPASKNYHHYLTREKFTEEFGPTGQDYQSLVNFAKTNGLTITATYPNRALLDVSGNVATINKVFHMTLRVYQHPTENRTFYAPDTEPSIDLDIPISDVSGLNNFELPHPVGTKNEPR